MKNLTNVVAVLGFVLSVGVVNVASAETLSCPGTASALVTVGGSLNGFYSAPVTRKLSYASASVNSAGNALQCNYQFATELGGTIYYPASANKTCPATADVTVAPVAFNGYLTKPFTLKGFTLTRQYSSPDKLTSYCEYKPPLQYELYEPTAANPAFKCANTPSSQSVATCVAPPAPVMPKNAIFSCQFPASMKSTYPTLPAGGSSKISWAGLSVSLIFDFTGPDEFKASAGIGNLCKIETGSPKFVCATGIQAKDPKTNKVVLSKLPSETTFTIQDTSPIAGYGVIPSSSTSIGINGKLLVNAQGGLTATLTEVKVSIAEGTMPILKDLQCTQF